MKEKNPKISEFRKDPVSGDWVLMAPGRKTRPDFSKIKKNKRIVPPFKNCPFENPGPVIFYEPKPGKSSSKDWFVRIVPNKYPALTPHKICPDEKKMNSYTIMKGAGFHEVIVTRPHKKTIAEFKTDEAEILIRAFQKRYKELKKEPCIEYILIFHNFGPSAGATIFHPHSQLVALPIIPLDTRRSLEGSRNYFEEHKKCAHCVMLATEKREKKRIVFENKDFILVCPFASRVSFEMRIYPKKHKPYFEEITDRERFSLAGILKEALSRLRKGVNDPDYNFFIHTALSKDGQHKYYHWHLEILPRISKWGGVELGSGIEVVVVAPEQAADILKKS